MYDLISQGNAGGITLQLFQADMLLEAFVFKTMADEGVFKQLEAQMGQ